MKYKLVDHKNIYIKQAFLYAMKYSLDTKHPTGCVLITKSACIFGTNGSNYHQNHPCKRKMLNLPTGVGYELCEGCNPKNHSEQKMIKYAKQHNIQTKDGKMYLWGHYYCCDSCIKKMEEAGITQTNLLKNSKIFFNKNNPNNIIGKKIFSS